VTLGEREVHVWYAFPDRFTDPALLANCETLLSPEEKARLKRFLFAKDRHQRLVAWSMVRATLSRYADVRPELWRFSTNSYGRPEIASPVVGPLRFNLSHTDGLIVCAVAWDRQIGVDVENVERPGSCADLAKRFFAPSEADHVGALPAERQQDVFFDYWTLKESYIKARGMGLALPLEDFAFRLDEPVTISFTGTIDDDPASWQFERLRPSDAHKAAVAVRRAAGCDLQLTVHEEVATDV
jgi:4'-phosphopantetheinyl transferase